MHQQSAATASADTDPIRPPKASELRQRPSSTSMRLDGKETVSRTYLRSASALLTAAPYVAGLATALAGAESECAPAEIVCGLLSGPEAPSRFAVFAPWSPSGKSPLAPGSDAPRAARGRECRTASIGAGPWHRQGRGCARHASGHCRNGAPAADWRGHRCPPYFRGTMYSTAADSGPTREWERVRLACARLGSRVLASAGVDLRR